MKQNRKSFRLLLAMSLIIGLILGGCKKEPEVLRIETEELKIMLMPSGSIEGIWGNLKLQEENLRTEFARYNCHVNKVTFTIAGSFDEILEALKSGETDIGYLPASYYEKLSKEPVVAGCVALDAIGEDYREVELYASKSVNGEELDFNTLNSLTFAVCSKSSLEGFMALDNWLHKEYKKGIEELANTVTARNIQEALELMYSKKASAVACYKETFANSGKLLAKYEGEGALPEDYYQAVKQLGTLPNDLVCYHLSDKLPKGFTKILSQTMNSFSQNPEIKAQFENMGHYGYREFVAENFTLLK